MATTPKEAQTFAHQLQSLKPEDRNVARSENLRLSETFKLMQPVLDAIFRGRYPDQNARGAHLDFQGGAGCFPARYLAKLRPGVRVLAVDKNLAALEQGYLQGKPDNLEYRHHDAVEAGIPKTPGEGWTSALWNQESIYTPEEKLVKTFKDLYSKMADGGKFTVVVPAPHALESYTEANYLFVAKLSFMFVQQILQGNPRLGAELPRILAEAGFDVVTPQEQVYKLGGPTKEGQDFLNAILKAYVHFAPAVAVLEQMAMIPPLKVDPETGANEFKASISKATIQNLAGKAEEGTVPFWIFTAEKKAAQT